MMSLERTKQFIFKGETYTVSYPKIGQMIDMESRKSMLSHGQYSNLVNVGTYSAFVTLDMLDMVVTLEALCSKLMANLKVPSLLELDTVDSLELLNVYKKEVIPWLTEWNKVITAYMKSPQEETEEKKPENETNE